MTHRFPRRLATAAIALTGVAGGGVAVASAASHPTRAGHSAVAVTGTRAMRVHNPVAAEIRQVLGHGGVIASLAGDVRIDRVSAADAQSLISVAVITATDLRRAQAKVMAVHATTSVARSERVVYRRATAVGLGAQTRLLAGARALKAGDTTVARSDLRAFNGAQTQALKQMASLGRAVGATR